MCSSVVVWSWSSLKSLNFGVFGLLVWVVADDLALPDEYVSGVPLQCPPTRVHHWGEQAQRRQYTRAALLSRQVIIRSRLDSAHVGRRTINN